MPWKNELPKEQKQRFINLAQSGHFTVTELSEEFGNFEFRVFHYSCDGMKSFSNRRWADSQL